MKILSTTQKELIIRILKAKLEDRLLIQSQQERTEEEIEETRELGRSIYYLSNSL